MILPNEELLRMLLENRTASYLEELEKDSEIFDLIQPLTMSGYYISKVTKSLVDQAVLGARIVHLEGSKEVQINLKCRMRRLGWPSTELTAKTKKAGLPQLERMKEIYSKIGISSHIAPNRWPTLVLEVET